MNHHRSKRLTESEVDIARAACEYTATRLIETINTQALTSKQLIAATQELLRLKQSLEPAYVSPVEEMCHEQD